MAEIIWVFLSYTLGSIPFGYIFSRLSGKDILEIGWKKTSGSNVFKNVGWKQGLLTGVFDVLKGYLAVYVAQRLGLPLEIQALSGAAAVTGHNWSLFLKFSGGRGIGTFIGAFFALSPQLLGIAIIPLILLAVIWNASPATLFFLATSLIAGAYFNQFESVGLLTLFSLVPIFIKRLSPIKEIPKAEKPFVLFRNRLLFDNDEALMNLRIKRILEKGRKNSGRVGKFVKPITGSVLIPPKAGWRAAKYGARMAQRPVGPAKEMISRGVKKLMGNKEKVVLELKAEDLKKMMLAAAKKIVLHQEEINKINVFPVADKDTGYNLAATLLGVEGVISRKNYSTLRELTQDIREAAMVNARGNAGMIYTGYLMEVLDRVKHLETIDAFHLSLAMKRGIKAARLSVAEPVEGTILDIVKAAGEESFNAAKTEKNIISVLEEALKVSQTALKETKEKLEVLKQNNVVDAGGLGFVKILEAWVESLKGAALLEEPSEEPAAFEEKTDGKPELKKEVVFSIEKISGNNLEELKKELSSLGESIDAIESDDKIKFHVHTISPEALKSKLDNFTISDWQEEDLIKQAVQKKSLGLVVGETADLPKEFLEKHQIELVPFKVNFPDIDKTPGETFYEKMKNAKKLPTTSAAVFGDYFSAYKKALDKFEKVLVITLSSRLSGAYSQARIARSIFRKPEKLNVYVFDCFAVEAAEGLVAIKAQELILQGKTIEQVAEYLKDFCPKVKCLGWVEDIKYIIFGGRLQLSKVLIPFNMLFQKIGVRPLLELKDGKIRFLSARTGSVVKILAEEVEKRRKGKPIKAAISHADNLKLAMELKKEIEKNPDVEVLFVSPISPVIGVHAGPGAVLVAFYPVDN